MKINSPNISKIIVELTLSDMSELDITYDDMDYSNVETRRVIWTILDKARHELGRDIDPSCNMTIETMPLNTGGCIIFFTVNDIPQSIKTVLSKGENVYEFDCIDNVIDLFSSMKEDFPSGDLYSDGKGKFRLITPFDERPAVKVRFKEYARLCREGRLAAEITKEHWKLRAVNFGFSAK